MNNLKEKSISAFAWSFINTGGTQLVGLVFGIALARILEPSDFGSIAIITFFTALSNVFVDAGLSHALIREKEVDQKDYSSIFYLGIIIALLCSFLLFFSSEKIALYYNIAILSPLTKVLSISPIIYSLMSINSTIITKKLDFKLKARLSLFAIVITNAIALLMAVLGMGIWSLAVIQVLNPFLLMILLWAKVGWRPSAYFSLENIKKYINFGIKYSISNLFNILYKSIYVAVIGRYYSSIETGYFAKANSLKNLPTVTLDKIVQRVTYPLISKLNNENADTAAMNSKIVRYNALIIFPIMIGMASVSEQFIYTLVGAKWLPATGYFTRLCFVGIFYPFISININIIKVKGKMNVLLMYDLFKILSLVPVLIIGVKIGITRMLYAMILHSVLLFIVSTLISNHLLRYSFWKYLKDIISPLLFSLCMFITITGILNNIMFSLYLELAMGVCIGILFILISYTFSKNREFLEIKKLVLRK